MGQQGLDCGAGVEPATPALGIVASQQDLGGDQAVGGERLLPGVHQQGLADGGGGLLVLQPTRRGVQPSAPQGHGAGGDDDDLAALTADVGDVLGQGGQPAAGDGAGVVVDEQGGADLDHHAAGVRQRRRGRGGGLGGDLGGGGGRGGRGHAFFLEHQSGGGHAWMRENRAARPKRKRPAGSNLPGVCIFSDDRRIRLPGRAPDPSRRPGP
ncbi:hypothetical protein D3C87_1543620 [compost metagenome]